MRPYAIAILTLALLLVACVPVQPTDSPTGQVVEPTPLPTEPVVSEPEPVEPAEIYTVTYTEGDLVKLRPVAIDPDGTEITYSFTTPIGNDGTWQTQIGNEGDYRIAVGASDGKSQTVETVLVRILRANRPPVIDCDTDITVNEGQTVDLHDLCAISDEDDTEVVVTYGGWMSGWKYDTTYDDAGDHTVRITASDRKDGEALHTVTKDVNVRVTNVNREPVFSDEFPQEIRATENDVVSIPTTGITDPDGNTLSYTYSAPFGANGVWRTTLGDAGTYDITVVASDGETTQARSVKVVVGLLNTVPVLREIRPITVDEGEEIVLPISATDREGDDLDIEVTGWMTSDTYQTTYEDAGEYTATVSVSDGEYTATQRVEIVVRDVNRPPVFVTPA